MSEVDPNFFAPVEMTPDAPSSHDEAANDHDARLIWDLVSKIRAPADVLRHYGLTAAQFAAKAQSPIFKNAYQEAERVWNSDMNIQTRVRLKAAFLLEDTLVPLHRIATNSNMPVRARLEAIEQLTKISTVSNVPKEVGAGGEKHNIVINIGGDRPPIKITAETKDERSEATIPAGT